MDENVRLLNNLQKERKKLVRGLERETVDKSKTRAILSQLLSLILDLKRKLGIEFNS